MDHVREFFDTDADCQAAWVEFKNWQPKGEVEVKLMRTMTWKDLARRYYERNKPLVIEEW